MQTALENSKRAMKEAADESEKLKFQIEDAASALEKIDQNSENAAERQEALKTRIKDLNVELEKTKTEYKSCISTPQNGRTVQTRHRKNSTICRQSLQQMQDILRKRHQAQIVQQVQ